MYIFLIVMFKLLFIYIIIFCCTVIIKTLLQIGHCQINKKIML